MCVCVHESVYMYMYVCVCVCECVYLSMYVRMCVSIVRYLSMPGNIFNIYISLSECQRKELDSNPQPRDDEASVQPLCQH